MTDRTLKIISAIKTSNLVWNRAVAQCMSEETGVPAEEYTETNINLILKNATVDYFSTCDNPGQKVDLLLNLIEHAGWASLGSTLSNFLGMQQVRNENGYINGFRKLNEKHNE